MHQLVEQGNGEFKETNNEKYWRLTDMIAGLEKKKACRLLIENGHCASIDQAKKLITQLLEIEYAVERDGKILRSGDLHKGSLNPIDETPPF